MAELLEKQTFTGRVLSRGEPGKIFIVYEPPNTMKIYGLGPELPRYLYFRGSYAEGSMDGQSFESIEDRDFRIFRILDPRVVLRQLEVGASESSEERITVFTGSYSLDFLELGNGSFLEEREGRTRWVEFRIRQTGFPESMIQQDLPGVERSLSVMFE